MTISFFNDMQVVVSNLQVMEATIQNDSTKESVAGTETSDHRTEDTAPAEEEVVGNKEITTDEGVATDENAITDEQTTTDEATTADVSSTTEGEVVTDDSSTTEGEVVTEGETTDGSVMVDEVPAADGMDVMPVMEGMPGMEGENAKKESLVNRTMDKVLSSYKYSIGITAGVFVFSIILGIVLAKIRIKKGIELYED